MASIVQRVARQALQTFRGPDPHLEQLRNLLMEVQAVDLKLVPQRESPETSPVSYMQICETETFSMGVFLLRGGASIPLHDHPHMHGLLKVLYGSLHISSFDLLPGGGTLRTSVHRSSAVHSQQSPPCVLSPRRDNLHCIEAVGGAAAFLDVLAPPYDPYGGRDCRYYKLVKPTSHQPGQEVLLMEIPQPASFWCGAEPYLGPPVHL